MTRKPRLAMLTLAALSVSACETIYVDFYTVSYTAASSGTSSSSGTGSGGTGGAPLCMPGATQPCYDGAPGTEGVGICKAGTQTCANDGASWGPCTNEVLPQLENCATPDDDNCDGAASPCKGDLLWADMFGGPGNDVATAAAIDSSSNVLLTGRSDDTVDFGGGPLMGMGGDDVFVTKLDPSGKHLWSRRFGQGANQEATAITTDSAQNVVLAGDFGGFVTFGGEFYTSQGGADVFVAKLSPSGQFLGAGSLATHKTSKRAP